MWEHKCNKEIPIATLEANYKTVAEQLKEIKALVQGWFKDINEKLELKYATKEELIKTDEKVSKITTIFEKIGTWAIRALLWSVIALIIYIYKVWK